MTCALRQLRSALCPCSGLPSVPVICLPSVPVICLPSVPVIRLPSVSVGSASCATKCLLCGLVTCLPNACRLEVLEFNNSSNNSSTHGPWAIYHVPSGTVCIDKRYDSNILWPVPILVAIPAVDMSSLLLFVFCTRAMTFQVTSIWCLHFTQTLQPC